MNGFINVIKPVGISSAGVVAKVKRALKCDAGHMGTLDPMATGVLPVALGKTCRLFNYLIDKEKSYVAEFVFGYETDTLDKTGKVTATVEKEVKEEDVKRVLPDFIGEKEQIPPKYSAKCVGGAKGYALARKGIDFELKPKTVSIFGLDVISYENNRLKIKIDCGGGTYVRSLGRDIAYALGTVATMESLDRTKSGVFEYSNGVTLEEFLSSTDKEKYILPADLPLTFDKIYLDGENAKRLKDGLPRWCKKPEGLYAVYSPQGILCIGEVKDGNLKGKTYVDG